MPRSEPVRAALGALRQNRWLLRLIGIGLFILILLKIDLREAWRLLLSVDLRYVLLSLVLQAIALVIAAYRWQVIVQGLGFRPLFRRTLLFQIIGTSAALVTPGQLGEFIKVVYQHRDGQPAADAALGVLIDRMCDLLLLIFFGMVGMAVVFGLSTRAILILGAVGLLLAAGVFLLTRYQAQTQQWLAAAAGRISPAVYRETVQAEAARLVAQAGGLPLNVIGLIVMLSLMNYALSMYRIYVLALALDVQVPFLYFILVAPLMRLAGLIPISVLGIGTRDVTTIYLLGMVGVSAPAALLLSTLGLITLQVQALVGLFFYWRYPLHAPAPIEAPGRKPVPADPVERLP